MAELKKILGMERQSLQLLLASHSLSEGEDALINFVPFVEELRGIFGEQGERILKENFGEKFQRKMIQYKITIAKINIIKAYKSGLTAHIIRTEDVTSKRFLKYKQAVASLPIVDEVVLFEVADILLRHTDIRDLVISSRYFNMCMPKERKIEELKERQMERYPESREEMTQ